MTQSVTIGITAYNAAPTIERAVCSALAQSWRPCEIIIVDDCSDDSTPDVLAALQDRTPGLRVLRHEVNRGMAAALNTILGLAGGEFLALFDDDDESLPDRVEAQLMRFLDYESKFAQGAPVVCHTARLQVYPDGSRLVVPTMGQNENSLAPSGRPVAERILLGRPLKNGYGACATCSQMARRLTYEFVGGFDAAIRRHSDTDLNIRLAMAGAHFVGIARPLVVQTMTRSSEKTLEQEYRNTVVLINKHRNLLDRPGEYEFCLKWIDVKQAWLDGRLIFFARLMASLLVNHPVLTLGRLVLAVPNFGLNLAFSRFHMRGGA